MKLRRHFVLAALAGKRKPLPALDSVRVAGFSTDSFCPITLNLLSYHANRKRAPV